jgi:hypothetical protein
VDLLSSKYQGLQQRAEQIGHGFIDKKNFQLLIISLELYLRLFGLRNALFIYKEIKL